MLPAPLLYASVAISCSPLQWNSAHCCKPHYVHHADLRKWAQLDGIGPIRVPKPWDVSHVYAVEPLSVAAFVAALYSWKRSTPSDGFVLDIGMNVGWYSWLASTVSPELDIIGVDMQPRCHEVAECGLRLQHNGSLPANVELLRRYVSSSADGATLQVPDDECNVMASPDGVLLPKHTHKVNVSTTPARSATMLPVRPIMLGAHLLEQFGSRKRAAVVKIDTEGFEARVLESLRPAWHLLGDIVLEITVKAWAHHNISLDEGLGTLRDVITANRYRVVTLPHTALGVGRGEAFWTNLGEELVDPCRLPHVNPKLPLPPNREWYRGLANATVLHWHHLENLVRNRMGGSFYEFLLTRKWEGCANLSEGASS